MRIDRSLAAFALCALLPVLPAEAQAPTASREPAVTSRTLRDAENPMRVIIEAGKLKQKAKPDAPVAAVPEKRPASPAVARPAAAPVAKSTAPAQAAPSIATPSPAPTEPAAAALAPAVEAPQPVEAAPAPQVAATPAPAPSASAPAQALLPLKLKQLVEPSLPAAALRRMRNDLEVVVGFIVNADGSVSNVVVRSSPMSVLDASVVEAVSQWRYEPIREARSHSVQLVLRANL